MYLEPLKRIFKISQPKAMRKSKVIAFCIMRFFNDFYIFCIFTFICFPFLLIFQIYFCFLQFFTLFIFFYLNPSHPLLIMLSNYNFFSSMALNSFHLDLFYISFSLLIFNYYVLNFFNCMSFQINPNIYKKNLKNT